MPKYNFTCDSCENKLHKYVSTSIETITCPKCGQSMKRDLPTINSNSEVREVVDPYLNKRLNKDHNAIMSERKREHYLNVEIPRLIEKYSLETCLENKWLVYNDKGELVINKDWTPSKASKV